MADACELAYKLEIYCSCRVMTRSGRKRLFQFSLFQVVSFATEYGYDKLFINGRPFSCSDEIGERDVNDRKIMQTCGNSCGNPNDMLYDVIRIIWNNYGTIMD